MIQKHILIGLTIAFAANPILAGIHWDTPTQGCDAYGVRSYTARLWDIPGGEDWGTACSRAPITVPGFLHNKVPNKCDNNGASGEIGEWYVPAPADDSYCRPTWGSFTFDKCVDNHKAHFYSRLMNIESGDWNKMCITAPATINGTNFAKPDSCKDKGVAGIYGNWNVPYKACGGHWGTLKDQGCSSDQPGFRRWGAQLLDITADWTDACTTHDATVKDEYFTKPTDCENSGLSGEWGYFEIMDSTCGVPPCPEDMAWDYENGMCMLCSWDGKTPPVKIDENQIAIEAPFWTRDPLSMTRTKHEIRSQLQKRVKCNPFNRPANVPQDVPYLPNDLQAWQDGHGHGPTVDIIAANATVREAFQRAWTDSFPTRTTMREMGGWIFANLHNPTRDFVIIHADAGGAVDSTNPPRDSLAINLSYPQRTLARARAGYVMVADFHTHPGGYATDNYGNSAIPSPADNRSEWRRGVPGILIHTNGLTAYGPASRAQMDRAGPQGFPNPNRETTEHDSDRGRPLEGWRPERPQNQPKVTNAPPPAPSPGTSQSGKDELR